jgi:hypothetical protein
MLLVQPRTSYECAFLQQGGHKAWQMKLFRDQMARSSGDNAKSSSN